MNIVETGELLYSAVNYVSDTFKDYVRNPRKDFSRVRKLPFDKMLKIIIGMGGASLANELIEEYDALEHMATVPAFIQQRDKIKPDAFEAVFHKFTSDVMQTVSSGEMRILAADGSDLHIPTDEKDKESFYPGTNNTAPYNLIHLNALYDIQKRIYVDACIHKNKAGNETGSLTNLADASAIKSALAIMDRGYEPYNVMAHIQEKGWKFLIRIKDGNTGIKQGLSLPETDEYDVPVNLSLTRRNTNKVKQLIKENNSYRRINSRVVFDYLPLTIQNPEEIQFFTLYFRIIRFRLDNGSYETIATNPAPSEYPKEKIKEMYAMRWSVEVSFRSLKYTVGLLRFHSKKMAGIWQEVFARLIMYNFSELATSHVAIKKKNRKYTYRADFSAAVKMCRKFIHAKIPPSDIEAIISRNLIPVRPGRHRERSMPKHKRFIGFLYGIA